MCTLRNVNRVCRMWLWKGFIHLAIQFSFVQISVIIVQRVEPHMFSVPSSLHPKNEDDERSHL